MHNIKGVTITNAYFLWIQTFSNTFSSFLYLKLLFGKKTYIPTLLILIFSVVDRFDVFDKLISYWYTTNPMSLAESKKRPGFVTCHVTVTSYVLRTTTILQILYDQNDQIERNWHSSNIKWFQLTLRKKWPTRRLSFTRHFEDTAYDMKPEYEWK